MKVLIFGGTAEGRMLVEERSRAGDEVVVCVTSEYARRLLPPGADCRVGAIDEAAMYDLLLAETPDLVIDATHPFAARATENIRGCAARVGIRLLRVERDAGAEQDWRDAVQWVPDATSAARALREVEGNILLTTGSHTLGEYLKALPPERVYARVLPTSQVLSHCESLGLLPGHAIAMQGPFSTALNAALYDQWRIHAMASKDSGEPGGVTDKILPALMRDIHVVMIQRPQEGV